MGIKIHLVKILKKMCSIIKRLKLKTINVFKKRKLGKINTSYTGKRFTIFKQLKEMEQKKIT